jgi:hypothetical protein
MRGYDRFNFPAFDACALQLRKWGWWVRSPAEHDRDCGFDETLNSLDGFDMQAALRWDIEAVLESHAVVLLTGWEASSGCAIELTVARAVGCEVYTYRADVHGTDLVVLSEDEQFAYQHRVIPAESPLAEADRLVSGDRQADYGHPIDDFTRTGRMWGAILGIPDVDPAHVGLCMAAVKISREVNKPKRDNITDLAGYAKTVHLVREQQALS